MTGFHEVRGFDILGGEASHLTALPPKSSLPVLKKKSLQSLKTLSQFGVLLR
jgi:hypothetical protein